MILYTCEIEIEKITSVTSYIIDEAEKPLNSTAGINNIGNNFLSGIFRKKSYLNNLIPQSMLKGVKL